jgi:glutamate N-acetyltransferase/amino-acid N-acetyltransferase
VAKIAHVSPLAPEGFPALPVIPGVRFAAAAAGVRYQGRTDVMLAEIAPGSTMAGVFTRSATRSAAVLWCQDCLIRDSAPGAGYAIIVNSGNSNAFTGRVGAQAVEATATGVAAVLGIPECHVFTASTGVIGVPLNPAPILAALPGLKAALTETGAEAAARAIMTTDTFAKGASVTADLEGVTITLTGFCKGSGMIQPDMATMLAFAFTDAAIARPVLQAALAQATDASFNCITVDSDTSTSDTLLLAATARAPMEPIATIYDPRYPAFLHALRRLLTDLAHQVVRDGEGATKFVAVTVTGAASDASARRIAFAIANSPLVKTAIAGQDPNWGRVVAAVGKAGEPADRDRLSIRFGDIQVATGGMVDPGYAEDAGAAYMQGQSLDISVDAGVGTGQATVWTCDLTHTYIDINADYRS